MSVIEHRLFEGDVLPKLRHQLKLNGTAIDLTTAAVAVLRERRSTGEVAPLAGTVTKIDALNGIVELAWDAADVADEGVYNLQWSLTWLDGRMTIPTDCPIRLHVLPRISGA